MRPRKDEGSVTVTGSAAVTQYLEAFQPAQNVAGTARSAERSPIDPGDVILELLARSSKSFADLKHETRLSFGVLNDALAALENRRLVVRTGQGDSETYSLTALGIATIAE